MAVRDFVNHRTYCADSDDETEHASERFQDLLSSFKAQSPLNAHDSRRSRILSSTNSDTDTESLLESKRFGTPPTFGRYRYQYSFLHHGSPVNPKSIPMYLPPIGVFWDIENCQVPKGRSAVAVTQVIREKFFSGYREAEFIVVCDVKKEKEQVVRELNDAQVNLVHVASTCKNAADEKLRQSIRRFADIHGSPAAIILISGDVNFAADLSDLRHRKKIHVILLHKTKNASNALILCANEHYDFAELMEPLPSRIPVKVSESYDLLICNLPKDKDAVAIKRRLKQLSENCGGRVIEVQPNAATVRFTSQDFAVRAQKRMDSEQVFGSKISVKFLKEEQNCGSKTPENVTTRDYTVSESETTVIGAPQQMYSTSASVGSARSLPVTPHYHSSSPVIGVYPGWNGLQCAPLNAPSGIIPRPPVSVGRPFSSAGDPTFSRSYNEHPRAQIPLAWQRAGSQQHGRLWEEQYKGERAKTLGKRIHIPQARDNCNAVANGVSPRTPEGLRRIRGYSQSSSFKRRSPSPRYATQGRDASQWNGQNQQSIPPRSNKTPSPYGSAMLQSIGLQTNRTSPYHQSDTENEEVENFFNPINNRNGGHTNNSAHTPIELQVTNLDQSIDPKEMKRILSSVFMEHVMILHVSVFMQSDGNFAASVKVPSLPDAQYAISQLHRRKVGYKRILISYAHSGGPNPQLVRSQIVMLLQEVPGHKLPLFKFREMFESRFMISISVSELYKMKDVCVITEDPGGRMVALNPDHRNTPSPCFNSTIQDGHLELPYCTIHTLRPWSDKGWAEQEMSSLPNVRVSLKVLAARIHQLLATHNGSLPLPSLPNCYEAEFKEQLNTDESGVPLEHLVSCLSSIELRQGVGSVKYLLCSGNQCQDDAYEENKCVSPPLANQLALFSRELVDLLKTTTHCQLSFNRFIPAYHHHFGRQCRVADYGFTKLIDLLEALTHTVQVMGEGNKRMVTLSHRAQVRRFTSDLLRVLKAQASKQVALSEFPNVYARVLGKPWDVVDYGVCEIGDILGEVSENTVVVTSFNDDDKMIAIPKREQTPEEIERTKQFAVEVVELLRHAPQCRMLFNKFVPSYHHHFGYQCRVSDYGFTKLIELFEAIPDIVKIEETDGGERRINLTEKEGLRVLGEQIHKLVAKSRNGLGVGNVAQAFLRQFGYALKPESFNCNTMLQLVEKLTGSVEIVQTSTGPVVLSIDKSRLQKLSLQCRRILMEQPTFSLPVEDFERFYLQYYAQPCDLAELEKDLPDVVKFKTVNCKRLIEMTPLQTFACNLYRVMMSHGGVLNVSQFESAYLAVIGSACRTAQYGHPTVSALLQALPCTVIFKETRHKKKVIYLNKKLAAVGIPLPPTYTLTSPYRDTDSSTDSIESDGSRTDASVTSVASEDRGKWPTQLPGNPNSWKQREEMDTWQNRSENDWSSMARGQTENYKWPTMESNGDKFLKSLIRTSVLHEEIPAPPKPDSPPIHENQNKEKRWNCSVWTTPPKYPYPQGEQSTNVDVPPLTLHQWNQIECGDSASDLLSPTKNLLPAAANPLNPRISPYFSSNRNPVVAPHPSELPLPSLSLTPKKSSASKLTKSSQRKEEVRSTNDTAIEPIRRPVSESDINVERDNVEQTDDTSSKRLFSGKRRLAAQFNRPIDS